jgi:hypothetical protein
MTAIASTTAAIMMGDVLRHGGSGDDGIEREDDVEEDDLHEDAGEAGTFAARPRAGCRARSRASGASQVFEEGKINAALTAPPWRARLFSCSPSLHGSKNWQTRNVGFASISGELRPKKRWSNARAWSGGR